MQLFRHEVLEHKRTSCLGRIIIARPVSFSVVVLVALAILAAAVAFISWGEYTKKARVSGFLSPQARECGCRRPAYADRSIWGFRGGT